MCICVSRCYHPSLQRKENLGQTVEEGDLFLVCADTQKLTEGTDEGVNAPLLMLGLDMSKVILKTAELEEIAAESQQG